MSDRVAWKSAALETFRVGAWGLLTYIGVSALTVIFKQNATGALGAQFVLAEFGMARLGVAWSDPLAPMPTTRDIVRRVLGGARFGTVAAAAIILAGLATYELERMTSRPSLIASGLGLLIAAATAARDELLLRGLPLRALTLLRAKLGGRGDALALVVVGLLSASARFGAGGHALDVAVFGCAGVALGALWLRDRGAWMAWGANLAFTWFTGPLVRGGLIDIRSTRGASDITSAPVALALSCAFAAVGMWSVLTRPRR